MLKCLKNCASKRIAIDEDKKVCLIIRQLIGRLVIAFEECIKEARSRCPKHILITLIDASYGYLCKEGKNGNGSGSFLITFKRFRTL